MQLLFACPTYSFLLSATSNIFGSGQGSITIETIIVPIQDHRIEAHGLHAGFNVFAHRHVLPQVSTITEKTLALLAPLPHEDNWFPDISEKGFRPAKDTSGIYQGRDLWFAFARLIQDWEGEGRCFDGLVVERSEQEGRMVFRRVGMGEGLFKPEGVERREDSYGQWWRNKGFTKGGWEMWQKLGERRDIVLV